ncbi:Putative thiamine biosynthesis protein (plasmid) [Aminobacter sp. MSH1]|uniref:ABC transporter substrate-binding protein n=1 Tax=Aminobacter sp. MSH1 TaxID=374606 RepID=UPI000D3B1A0C|nr:ABC transporter substrate-binding protein [Aminobacter sp. MSH1]AWC25827.1 Putative thiamine biosynthesis protein [Aminobacter sp. MSH1]
MAISRVLSTSLMAATFFGFASAASAEPVRFAWPSAINSGVAPLVFAEKLGLFEREGLELDIVVLTGSGVIVPQLHAGAIDAAYSGLEPAILSHQPNAADLGVFFIYNYIPNSIWELAVREDSDIKSLADLKGKTIGVLALGSSNVLTTKAILQGAGISPDEVSFQAVGVGAAAYEALKSGQIDVLNLFDTAHKRLELAGTPIRLLEMPGNFAGSSHGISVLKSGYAERKDYWTRFGRVLAESNVACQANIEGCIRAYWEAYPELAPTADKESAALETEKKVLEARLAKLLDIPGQYGEFSKGDWTSLVEALELGRLVTDPNVSLDLYYTNELVPAFNDFNKDDIVKLAKEVK